MLHIPLGVEVKKIIKTKPHPERASSSVGEGHKKRKKEKKRNLCKK